MDVLFGAGELIRLIARVAAAKLTSRHRKVNPSGRLTQTIAKKQSDYNAHVLGECSTTSRRRLGAHPNLYSFTDNSSMSTPQITYKEKLLVDYKWYE